ncbi:hypothetical protein CHS0354_033522 [Potamilus streckersoni]|uniref:Uncharacterized protein n=1 Tax=Potamilus streckersoni TaxID=2493646 RepID=A0AAE0VQI8_9BIVA|nr:hypothetical protein CHS0354_033522 [Potamilus streckersoni]
MGTDVDKSKQSKILIYLQCYFVTIATILGVGILGLPVTLTYSGLYPFLVTFLCGAVIQALTVVFFTDLLQRAYAVQLQGQKEEMIPLAGTNDMLTNEGCDEMEEEIDTSGRSLTDHEVTSREMNVQAPNLHLLGQLFLDCGTRWFFDIVLVLQFVALLISYALAGSEAFAQIIGISHFQVIPVFVWVLTFLILFALQLIQPIVSVLTFFKGSLLLGTVIVTLYVGSSIHREIHNDFTQSGAPFLMGTVALGGVVNTMPFMYNKISPSKDQIQKYRLAVVLGLATCALLNILWCLAVLDIVPQLRIESCGQGVCYNNISLQSAEEHGEISTIPLTEMIHRYYPSFGWVAILVELFIIVSITVSYLTIGAVLHHTLRGWVQSFWNKKKDTLAAYNEKLVVKDCCSKCSLQCLCDRILSLAVFGIVFIVAMLDPQGFVDMLEKFASMMINGEVGLFVFLMLLRSRNKENRKLKIPLPLPPWMYHLQYLIPLYFGFAVAYDIYSTVYDIVSKYSTAEHNINSSIFWNGTSNNISVSKVM